MSIISVQTQATAEKTAVILQTYSPRDRIGILVEDSLELTLGRRITVDENSPDATGDLAEKLSAPYADVHVIHRPSKLGLARAHIPT